MFSGLQNVLGCLLWGYFDLQGVCGAFLGCFFASDRALEPVQGRLWTGNADHSYPGASGQQLHWQHQCECKCADGSCYLEPVLG